MKDIFFYWRKIYFKLLNIMFENSLEIISYFYLKKNNKFYVNKNIIFYFECKCSNTKFIKKSNYNKIEIKNTFLDLNKIFDLFYLYKFRKANFNCTRYEILKRAQLMFCNFTWILDIKITWGSFLFNLVAKDSDKLKQIFYTLRFYEFIILTKIINLKFYLEFKKNLQLVNNICILKGNISNINSLKAVWYLNEALFGSKRVYFILNLIQNFIKTIIINDSSVRIQFYISYFKTKEILFLDTILKTTIRQRSSYIVFKLPIKQILRKAEIIGFVKKINFKASSVGYLTNYTHAEILEFYNKFIIKLLRNYFFVNNYRSFNFLIYRLKRSCALTLTLKYKLRFAGKVFKKYGETLMCPETKKHFFTLI
uniref:Domain X domain-containing protein n=1 Tax=Rhodogorgon sp. TaxID=2485824 RepID=A0A3G3MIL0_9FLOR|nr:hypothetical protein [Rhodogorgon sp.]